MIEEIVDEPVVDSPKKEVVEPDFDQEVTPVKPNKKPSIQPNILMKQDEKSSIKSGVKFDET